MTELVLNGFNGLRTGVRGVASVWGLMLAIPLAVAALDATRLRDVLQIASAAFVGTLPYIAAAVLLIASLKASGATALVARTFEGRETRMILLAALLGGLAPFCSCEVIPVIAGLLAVGAPLSAIMAFWLSSPLTGPFRYDYSGQDESWVYSRDGHTLQDKLSDELSELLGREITIL